MKPVHELLNRIQYDEDFANASFVIGFYDRLEDRIIRIPMKELYLDKDDHYFFHLYDEDGEQHNIPLHRIKQVFRNDELIWHREH